MVVDYSKWDKLELSDDSDIEVHPNVDKKSFIRWKQRDIHEKREQAKFRIKQLEVNLETNEDLLRRVNKLIQAGNEGRKIGLDVPGDVRLAEEGETKNKPLKATSPEQPRYTDMIESMLLQIVAADGRPDAAIANLNEHKAMIEGAMKDEQKELEKLEEERKEHITADDIRTGWDSTIVYGKDTASPTSAPTPTSVPSTSTSPTNISNTSSKSQSIETLNPKPKILDSGLEELLPATEMFGLIKAGDFQKAYEYMMSHPYIVTENQKDSLTMSAFDYQLQNQTERAHQIVWASTLIQYCAALGKDGCRIFFDKMKDINHPARKAFDDAVQTTYTHIRNRCEILKAEADDDDDNKEETIQLQAIEPGTEILINVPQPSTEGYEVYEKFSPEAKKAIETKQLDKVNEYLASLSIEEGEEFVGLLGDSGVISVENKIYEPEEWQQMKHEHDLQTPSVEDVD